MKERVRYFSFRFIALALTALAPWSAFGENFEHPGYIDSVDDERFEITREVYIMPPVEDSTPSLRERIFTDKISKDIQREYQSRFGYTEAEQLETASNRFVEFEYASGRLMPVNEHIDEQQEFGEYIGKELTEYHVNRYLKSNRSTRTIYEVKEKISNVNLETESGYEFKLRYKLSSNTANFHFQKPGGRFHNRFSVDMSNSQNVGLMLAYDVTKTLQILTDYQSEYEMVTVSTIKTLSPNLKTSLTGQSWAKDRDEDSPAQDRVLLGLTWTD